MLMVRLNTFRKVGRNSRCRTALPNSAQTLTQGILTARNSPPTTRMSLDRGVFWGRNTAAVVMAMTHAFGLTA